MVLEDVDSLRAFVYEICEAIKERALETKSEKRMKQKNKKIKI